MFKSYNELVDFQKRQYYEKKERKRRNNKYDKKDDDDDSDLLVKNRLELFKFSSTLYNTRLKTYFTRLRILHNRPSL